MAERTEAERDPLIGRLIAGRLELLELIGKGAMGRVYRAHHKTLNKPVAIKVLLSNASSEVVIRFKREAQTASRLDHPHSVQILDFGEDGPDHLLYLAMEYLKGENLNNVLQRVPQLSAVRACRIMSQTLSALAVAHDAGVIHRDLKPANIMLTMRPDENGTLGDFVKVCDFGIAKIMDTADGREGPFGATVTKNGAIFGTPAYMAPEQVRGEKIDSRADLYACGVMMYRMLAGRPPFVADTSVGVLIKQMNEDPKPLSRLTSTVDSRLEAVVMKALAKDPDQRYQHAREMRDALRELTEAPSGTKRPGSPPPIAALPAREEIAPTRAIQPLSSRAQSRPPPEARPLASEVAVISRPPPAERTIGNTADLSRVALQARETERSRSNGKLIAFAALVLAIGGVTFFLTRGGSVAELHDLVASNTYGVAETYLLTHFEKFKLDSEASDLAKETLRQRRESERLPEVYELPFDPTYDLSTQLNWTGTINYPDRKMAQRFTLVFQSFPSERTFEGYLDMPDFGLRAAVRGYRDGNHLLLEDYKLIAGSGAYAKQYAAEKRNVLVFDGKMIGTEGTFGGRFEATAGKAR